MGSSAEPIQTHHGKGDCVGVSSITDEQTIILSTLAFQDSKPTFAEIYKDGSPKSTK